MNLQPETLSVAQHQFAMAKHLRDPDHVSSPKGLDDRRTGIYRELVFNNIESLLSESFPVIRSIFADNKWLALVREFLVDYRAQSPYFTQLSAEFVTFLIERQQQPDEPEFLRELAHYERVELDVYMADREAAAQASSHKLLDSESLLDSYLTLSAVAQPLAYQFPVHRIGPDFQPEAAPDTPTFLLVFQDEAEEVRFWELQPLAFQLVSMIAANGADNSELLTVKAMLIELAESLKIADVDQFVQQGEGLLNQLNALSIFTFN